MSYSGFQVNEVQSAFITLLRDWLECTLSTWNMLYFLRVFCQSIQFLPSNEITDFIKDGYFFEEKPRFKIRQSTADVKESDWQAIAVHYQPDKRPIIIQRNVTDKLVEQEIKETIEMLKRSLQHSTQQLDIVRQLADSKQIIALEIDPVGITDAGWEMLDCLEAYLVSNLSGIVYAPDQGFYDRKLQLIYKFEPNSTQAKMAFQG